MLGTFVKDWFRYESHFVHGRDSLVDILKERGLLSESDAVQPLIFFSSRRRHTRFDCVWSSDVCSSDLVVFYMFSGPDFLYVDQFFPNASVYILCGKESMGPPPDPLQIGNLGSALHNLEQEMYSSLRFSFFITKDMKVSLDSQELKGTLPILYVFLARADKSITDVSFGSLSSSGQFQQSRGGGANGVRINYIDNHSGQQQTLYYFTTDISDGGLASSGFLRFCDHFGVGSSFLKSSSYLMFEQGFSRIRNFIIDHSATIVQDDAGIPLADFNRDKWNIRVFGTYIGPIEIFKQHYQPKLNEIFEQSGPPPIEFNFGYRWNYKESHVIVATRN